MHAGMQHNLKKRNALLAAALSLLAITFLFFPGTEGMAWMMWRDTPWLAAPLALAGLVCMVLWWRTPRS